MTLRVVKNAVAAIFLFMCGCSVHMNDQGGVYDKTYHSDVKSVLLLDKFSRQTDVRVRHLFFDALKNNLARCNVALNEVQLDAVSLDINRDIDAKIKENNADSLLYVLTTAVDLNQKSQIMGETFRTKFTDIASRKTVWVNDYNISIQSFTLEGFTFDQTRQMVTKVADSIFEKLQKIGILKNCH